MSDVDTLIALMKGFSRADGPRRHGTQEKHRRSLLETSPALPTSSGMCGRYASFLPPEMIARLFGTKNALPNIKPTWNMAPSQEAMVIRHHEEGGERHLDVLRWGLIPYFTKVLKSAQKPINARSETVATSGMFKEAFAMRRCLVPAPIYYEWRDDPEGKVPFAVARIDGDPVAFGGFGSGGTRPTARWCRRSPPSPPTPMRRSSASRTACR